VRKVRRKNKSYGMKCGPVEVVVVEVIVAVVIAASPKK